MKLVLLRKLTKPGKVEKTAEIVDEEVIQQYEDWDERGPDIYQAEKPGLWAMAFDPNIFDCPRCGGDGGWDDDYGRAEVCSLCEGRGRIDTRETFPSEMSEEETELIGGELDYLVRVWGGVLLTPYNYLYWLSYNYKTRNRQERLVEASELEEGGEREDAVRKIAGVLAKSLEEELSHLEVWEGKGGNE